MANIANFQTGATLPVSIVIVRLQAENRRKDSTIKAKNRQIDMLIRMLSSKN